MSQEDRPTIELLPAYVFCAPMDDGRIALMLPILPPRVIYNDPAYKTFIHAFDSVIVEKHGDHDNADLVGTVYVYHQSVIYKVSALAPFLEAYLAIAKAVIVPYCSEEGLPQQDIYGGEVPVVQRDKMTAEAA